jgi:hypothetical protein
MSTFVHRMSKKCHFVSMAFYDNEHLSKILLTFGFDIRDSPVAITIMALRKDEGTLKNTLKLLFLKLYFCTKI